jgi:glutamine synthetase adenylyltransferase
MSTPHVPPWPFEPARVTRAFAALAERGFTAPDEKARALLAGAFGNSGFLVRLGLRETQTLSDYFTGGPDAIVKAACALALAPASDEAQTMAKLRLAKRRAALAIALADIGGAWDFAQVTGALTGLADACVKGALAVSAGAHGGAAKSCAAGWRGAGKRHRPYHPGDGKIRRP